MAVVAVDNKVTPLAIILRLRLRKKHLTQPTQRYFVTRPTGAVRAELPLPEVIVAKHFVVEPLLLDVFAAEDN